MPLIGMQLSSEINWELFDFIVAGILITVLISRYLEEIKLIQKNKFFIFWLYI